MTCEVAVMNRRGIALAADSAVTLGGGAKIYNTAEKLFCISGDLPVGIMTFGMADLMGVPWETIVKIYARRLGETRYGTLEEYANDLLSFVESSDMFFPKDAQRDYVLRDIDYVWRGYRNRVESRINDADLASSTFVKTLAKVIEDDHTYFKKYDTGLGTAFSKSILKTYQHDIDMIEKDIFGQFNLPARLHTALRKTVDYMFSTKWVLSATSSNIVVAGMGETEAFPRLIEYAISGYVQSKLVRVERNRAEVGIESDGFVVPFGQSETADTIIQGVHPNLREWLCEEMETLIDANPKAPKSLRDGIVKLQDRMHGFVAEHYEQPFMQSVAGLPRRDLAKMAEALVSLTAFVMRMSFDQHETVAEPIDVAILSKGDGFTWIKHKDLNNQIAVGTVNL